MEINFKVSFALRHFEYDNPELRPKHRDEPEKHPIMNMVRDGRDVMVACWYYYQTISAKNFPYQIFKNLSFKDFLHGNYNHPEASEIDFQHWTNLMFDDPIKYWINFVEGWLDRGTLIRFEDLKTRGFETLEKIREQFNLKGSGEPFQEVTELVGVQPRKGIIGDWQNHFDESDQNYFWLKAGNLMDKLGYGR